MLGFLGRDVQQILTFYGIDVAGVVRECGVGALALAGVASDVVGVVVKIGRVGKPANCRRCNLRRPDREVLWFGNLWDTGNDCHLPLSEEKRLPGGTTTPVDKKCDGRPRVQMYDRRGAVYFV